MFKHYCFFILCVICGIGCSSSEKLTQPHIIFIVADDVGWNDYSFHGADEIPTPNIDALAYNGVILNRHYVHHICTPSRTALMTGRYAIRSGMQGFPLEPDEVRITPPNTLMPEFLKRLGYKTSLVGKWHLGYYKPEETPARRGFDTFYGYYNGFIEYYNYTIKNHYEKNQMMGYDMHDDNQEELKVTYPNGYFTDVLTDKAVEIIKKNGNDQPLFLEISHLAGHVSDNTDPMEVRDMAEADATFPHISDINHRKYAAMLKAMDESVGRVVKTLNETNMLSNSIIVFISDNGAPTVGLYSNTGSNHPFRGMKTTLWEGGVRGAACVFSPLIKAHSRVSGKLMHIVDWLPTLYRAGGGKVSDLPTLDGLDQWGMISQDEESPRNSLLVNIDEVAKTEAAIMGRYKLIKESEGKNGAFLGDSGNDPSFPAYDEQDVLRSDAGSAIAQLEGFNSASSERMKELRKQSIVRCGKPVSPCTRLPQCSHRCLFDIQEDPCEMTDLSKTKPEIVEKLEAMLDNFRSQMVLQSEKKRDPCSAPIYCNGTWMPWVATGTAMETYKLGDCRYPAEDEIKVCSLRHHLL